MNQIMVLWQDFISLFPMELQGLIALLIFVGIVLMLIDLIKRNFIWILLLIIFVPASVPIFRTIVDGIFYFLRNVLP